MVVLGNVPYFPPVLLQGDRGITPITSKELGGYETGNNEVFN